MLSAASRTAAHGRLRAAIQHSLDTEASVKDKGRVDAVIDHCIDQMCADGDGGEKGMDLVMAEGCEFQELRPETTGFTKWERGGEPRGNAEWMVPPGCTDWSRRMLFLHGGSYMWYKPSDQCYRVMASKLAVSLGVPVLSIDYRLADPKGQPGGHQFPAALHDALAAVRWLSCNTPRQLDGGDVAEKLFVAGDSAGGGLALATAVAIRDSNSRQGGGGADPQESATFMAEACGVREPDAVALFSPWANLTCAGPSYTVCAWDAAARRGDFLLSKGDPAEELPAYQEQAGFYAGPAGPEHPLVSPVFAEDLGGLPPLFVNAGTAEVCLSDAVSIVEKVRACGGGGGGGGGGSSVGGADAEVGAGAENGAEECQEGIFQPPQGKGGSKGEGEGEVAVGRGTVQFKVWPRMWHVFVAYQDGYGAGPLSPAITAMEECARFFKANS